MNPDAGGDDKPPHDRIDYDYCELYSAAHAEDRDAANLAGASRDINALETERYLA